MGVEMDRERVWQAVAAERSGVAEMLAGLTPPEWERPSLCPGWRVRDVAAHLTLAPQGSVRTALVELVRARGNFSRMIYSTARRAAEEPVDRILERLRETASARRLPPGVTPATTLMDVLVHAQDMAIPLGRPHAMPAEMAAVAADRAWSMGWPFHARRRLAGFRLVATDVAWSRGSGAEVVGGIDAILLLLTGRTAGLARLSGEGGATLRRTMAVD
jgi:uncharacterized protein (TIGR03083 family)